MFQILAVVSLEQHEGTKTLLIDQSINYTSQDLLESSSQIFLQATYFWLSALQQLVIFGL